MSVLDPLFGSMPPSGLLCELRLSVIRSEAKKIAATADMLWLRKEPSAALARLDLAKSIQELRDAASVLELLLGKNVTAEAAE